MSAIVKVFRMPADDGRGSELRGLGPAFENLQGRKSREAMRRGCGAAAAHRTVRQVAEA